jgi:hypothetical protein
MSNGAHSDGQKKQANTKITWVSSVNPEAQRLCGSNETAPFSKPMNFLNHIQFGSITYFLPHVMDLVGYQSTDVLDYDAENGRVKLLFLRRNHGNTFT